MENAHMCRSLVNDYDHGGGGGVMSFLLTILFRLIL